MLLMENLDETVIKMYPTNLQYFIWTGVTDDSSNDIKMINSYSKNKEFDFVYNCFHLYCLTGATDTQYEMFKYFYNKQCAKMYYCI